MNKLKVSDLRLFFRKTAQMKQNKIMQLLSYLKVAYANGSAFITKTNLSSFCEMSIDGSGEGEYLISEQVLRSLVGVTKDEYITFSLTDGKISLSDSDNSVSSPTDDLKLFPCTPETDFSDFKELTHDIISSIFIAKSFLAKEETAAHWTCVHLISDDKGTIVFGSDTTIIYFKEFSTPSCSAVLDGEALATISSMTEVEIKEEERHFVVRDDNIVFYFLKSNYITPSLSILLSHVKKPGKKFTINKKDILSFCEITSSISKEPTPVCTMKEVAEDSLMLSYDGGIFGNSNSKSICTEKSEPVDDYSFSCKMMTNVLKAIPSDELLCRTINGSLVFESEDDPSAFATIQQICLA